MAGRMIAEAVRSESAHGRVVPLRPPLQKDDERPRGENPPHELRADVPREVLPRESLRGAEPHGNRWVQVAPGHVPDRVRAAEAACCRSARKSPRIISWSVNSST